jgi:gluconolactonase
MKESIIFYRRDATELLGKSPLINRISNGYHFAEGPLWHPKGYLLFSDVKANKIFQVYMTGVIHVLLQQSGSQYVCSKYLSDMVGSNGLALDQNTNVIFCQHANHSIAKLDKNKNVIQLCTSYNGKPFNSPNDLVIKSDGGIYFTDPPYGLQKEVLNPDIFQPHSGVYKFQNNTVSLLATDLNYPNGICFSNDERFLFVSSNHPDEKFLYKYTLSPKGTIINKHVFAHINADGIKTDILGNVYAATNKGVVILSPEGNEIALITLPEPATNLTFGGADGNLLFATTYHSIYTVGTNLPSHALQVRQTSFSLVSK